MDTRAAERRTFIKRLHDSTFLTGKRKLLISFSIKLDQFWNSTWIRLSTAHLNGVRGTRSLEARRYISILKNMLNYK